MRTPKRPGRYTPGSTVTTLPAHELASDAVAEARLLVDVEADAVARAVVEVLAVAAPRRSRAAPSRAPPGSPARGGRARARPPARPARSRRRPSSAARSGRSRTCACSRSSSRRRARPRSSTTSVERSISERAGHGVRLRAVGAGGDDRRERRAVGAELARALLDRPGHLALLAAGQARPRPARRRSVRAAISPRPGSQLPTSSHSRPPASSAVFTTSAMPAAHSRGGSVSSSTGSAEHAASGCQNAPTSFFAATLIAVLPPIAASTCPTSVDGTASQGRPRRNVAAAKPPTSVMEPPPAHTTTSPRSSSRRRGRATAPPAWPSDFACSPPSTRSPRRPAPRERQRAVDDRDGARRRARRSALPATRPDLLRDRRRDLARRIRRLRRSRRQRPGRAARARRAALERRARRAPAAARPARRRSRCQHVATGTSSHTHSARSRTQRARRRGRQRAAAERDHGASSRSSSSRDHRLLERAERRLAVALQECADRAAERVARPARRLSANGTPSRCGEHAPDRALAGRP